MCFSIILYYLVFYIDYLQVVFVLVDFNDGFQFVQCNCGCYECDGSSNFCGCGCGEWCGGCGCGEGGCGCGGCGNCNLGVFQQCGFCCNEELQNI